MDELELERRLNKIEAGVQKTIDLQTIANGRLTRNEAALATTQEAMASHIGRHAVIDAHDQGVKEGRQALGYIDLGKIGILVSALVGGIGWVLQNGPEFIR